MTPEEFERVKDWSVRMARYGLGPRTERRKERLAEEVLGFWDSLAYDPADVTGITSWDQDETPLCDLFREHFAEFDESTWSQHHPDRYGQFYDDLAICIRSGIDLVESAVGVLGFTVGDVRRMYPEGLPEWFVQRYECPVCVTEAADDAGIWL